MNVKAALAQLEALGNEKMRTQNERHGASGNQFGVRRGDVRKLARGDPGRPPARPGSLGDRQHRRPLGVFRDYPTSRGCTSPFVPIWIDAMVARQG